MVKEIKTCDRTVLSSGYSSNGFLVSVTNLFNFSNDNDHLDTKSNQLRNLRIIAQLTNSNRLYKISSLTKTLSENNNQIIYFDIKLYNEWSSACSFISIGDVVEIFGGFVSKNKNNIKYEYSTSKRDSSMVVWRSGFEHIPAVLTHAAVLCSKGNIYLPAWARIYNNKSRLEGLENIKYPSHYSFKSFETLETSETTDNSYLNEICSNRNENIPNQKKRRASNDVKNSSQNFQYSYIEKLSDIVPRVSTNLFGVVLEVGNNPIKRCGSRNSHIFLNVTLIDPSVIELIPVDKCSSTLLDDLMSGIYNFNNRPRLNPNFPTISLEVATDGEANTLPIINLGDIIRVHRVEPTISKQKYIDLPYNTKNTSIRIWSIYDLNIEEIYSKYSTDEEIYQSQDCYFTVENALKVGTVQQRTTFTKEDSFRLLKLQRWCYELFHEYPFFSISPYTKSLKYLSDSQFNTNSRRFGDIIVMIHDICILPEFVKKSTLVDEGDSNTFVQGSNKDSGRDFLYLIVTEHKQCERITFGDLTEYSYDEVFIVWVSESHNYGLKDYFINNQNPLTFGDWIRIKNVSILGSDYFTYLDEKIVGPFTLIDTNRSRITRLPFWSGDVKLLSSRVSPMSKKKSSAIN
ncbi:Nucleic acid-binding OB-fold-containing protein [Cryptosporidium felis]|nr:Nucleic acid-binding OB-fold-containing protein [Cryptosporidium felis]